MLCIRSRSNDKDKDKANVKPNEPHERLCFR
jgi:hypothetical protein